jgi:hypothetical protein
MRPTRTRTVHPADSGACQLATTRFLSATLYGVNGSDPLTLAGAVTLLVVTSMAASYIPARRGASVDPARSVADQ